jgi:hypothetical protein
MKKLRKLPIGIQDFMSLREDGYLYVDKTALMYRMITENKVYFLSRPRRFGKSLLISTLAAYFLGKKEYFKGLAIEEFEEDWIEYPVLRIDLNAKEYTEGKAYLIDLLIKQLASIYETYEIAMPEGDAPFLFQNLLKRLHQKTGKRAVVLIDEYDKPLLATLDKPELLEQMKSVLKPFFGVLKSADEHLKFLLLTGVTKFGQVSVFSDLNQLFDISLSETYATLCGMTFDEVTQNFAPEIDALAIKEEISRDECLEKIKLWYNGYKFEENAEGVYNPFSTLSLFQSQKFENHWFQTGTPTFLVELLKSSDYDLRDIEGVELQADSFANYRADADRPLPVLYQSGYLTIKSYDKEFRFYTLGYPNFEVKYSLLAFFTQDYTSLDRDNSGTNVRRFYQDLLKGDLDSFMIRVQAFFSKIPYDLIQNNEKYYQMVLYIIFTLLGQYTKAEVRSSFGRADLIVENKEFVYIFEFKLFDTAENALLQIEEKGYAIPYLADSRKIVKVGAEFSVVTKNVNRWLVV